MSLAILTGTGRVSIGTPTIVNNVTAMTIAAWIKPFGVGDGGFGMISVKRSGTNVGWEFFMDSATTKFGFYRYFSTSGMYIRSDAVLAAGRWNFVCAATDGSPTIPGTKLYVDNGMQVTEVTYSGSDTGLGTIIDDSTESLFIGSLGANNTFNGLISHVQLFNKTLSLQEINKICRAPGSIPTIGYWPLYGGTTLEPDLSKYVNNGTLAGTPQKGDDPPIGRGVRKGRRISTHKAVNYMPYKDFLLSANAQFLNLQSGNARPYFYIEAIISGTTSVIGESFTATNWLIDGGTIDREKPALPGDRSNIFSADVTLKLDNSTKRFSPRDTSSVFFGNTYLQSPFNYWAGFVAPSGTALLVQRGSFIMDTLRLDGRAGVAYVRLRDKFHETLDLSIGSVDVSGTAIEYVASGIIDGSTVLQQLFITGAGLTAGDLSLQTAGISFSQISFSRQVVAQAAALVAEASDGYLYTDRKGVLKFVSNAPVFGSATATFTIRDSTFAKNIVYEESQADQLSKVTVEYQSGTSSSYISEDLSHTANSLVISNDSIQGTPEAQAIASRVRDRFSGLATRLEIDSVWLPSLDLDDRITVYLSGLGLSGHNFRIHKIQEEPTNGTMSIFAISERGVKSNEDNKFGFISDPDHADPSGGTFTGGAGELNGWQAGWIFCAALNTGFDADGDANNAINTSVTASGAGGTGIEVPFLCY